MMLPMSALLAPPMISGTTNIPNEEMKTRMEPAATPGMVRGRVTLRKATLGGAPRSLAASRSLLSICSRET